MADNWSKKRRKRATGAQPPAKKARRKKPRPQPESDSDDSSAESLAPMKETPLPLMEDEPTSKLPEELLKKLYKKPGVLLITGMVSWDVVGKKDNKIIRTHPKLYSFHKFTDKKYRLIASGCNSAHSVLVTEDGKTLTFGRNKNGQLGLGNTDTVDVPTEVAALKNRNIIQAATGRNHTLFLSDAGTVYACGDNHSGQCGVGNTVARLLTPTRINYLGVPIVKICCGADFSVILDCNGVLHSFGLPEYGQLGHNTDGKYFETSSKMSYHYEMSPKRIVLYIEKSKEGVVTPIENVEIVDFSCGSNHTVAVDSKKRAYSWGFGGYGRLGHAEPRDEHVPRLIKYMEIRSLGVRSVYCGYTYSLAIDYTGTLFMFGQTKLSGEANMYPKPVQDLAGWNIRAVGTSYKSIMVNADESLIAWGPAPTYGELGTGESIKSSARPMKVNKMEGMKVSQVSMGYSHTMLLCDDTTDAVRAKLAAMPEFKP